MSDKRPRAHFFNCPPGQQLIRLDVRNCLADGLDVYVCEDVKLCQNVCVYVCAYAHVYACFLIMYVYMYMYVYMKIEEFLPHGVTCILRQCLVLLCCASRSCLTLLDVDWIHVW